MQLATVCLQISGFGKSKSKHEDFMICKKTKEIEKTDQQKNEEVLLNFFFKNGVK